MSTSSFGGRVHAAVAAGQSVEEVRRVIDVCAPRSDERALAEAVNEEGGDNNNETPLQAAHIMRREDLVGLLLEEGAIARDLRNFDCGATATALALCVCYDLPETLRALLRKGHDANQRLQYLFGGLPVPDHGSTIAHLCVDPPRLPAFDAFRTPRLACLEALVREGGVSVDGRDQRGRTPLHWVTRRTDIGGAAAIDLLVRLGADVNARDEDGRTPIFESAISNNVESLRRLLEHGALPGVVNNCGRTPLMSACIYIDYFDTCDVALELARHSSPETCRAVGPRAHVCPGYSAIDFMASNDKGTWTPQQKQVVAELLVSGASVQPEHAADVLPVAVSHGLPRAAQKEAELAAVRPAERCTTSWRAHEAFAGLAMDVKELRAAEKEVEDKKRRMLELEAELLGGGAESSSSSGSDENESGDDESESDGEDESGSNGEVEEAAAPTGSGGE